VIATTVAEVLVMALALGLVVAVLIFSRFLKARTGFLLIILAVLAVTLAAMRQKGLL
jgi:hypothetical protein